MKLFFVVTPHIVREPTCSFKFMFDSDMPRAWVGDKLWGFLLPMFEPQAGQDTQIFVFQSGVGQVLSGAFGSHEDLSEFENVLGDGAGWLDKDTILCVEQGTFNRLKIALDRMGVSYEVHTTEKVLRTQG